MRKALGIQTVLMAAVGVILFASPSQAATNSGNGNSSFGGVLGTGSLTLTDNGTTVSGTFTKGAGNFNDAIVIYIDSVSGGFNTTSGFNDQNDPTRSAISGVGGFGRSTVNFASGFNADYAIGLGANAGAGLGFGGLWSLANGGNNSLPFITSVNLNPNNNVSSTTYTFSFDLAQIGLNPNVGSSFNFVATLLAPSGYRSNEAIGSSDAPGGDIAGGTLDFTGFQTFTAVPEPSTLALLGLGALTTVGFLRRRK